MENKICKKCKKNYPATLECFYRNRNNKDDLNGTCNVCLKQYKAKYYRKNKERICKKSNLRYLKFSDKIKRYSKEYYLKNKEKRKEYDAKCRKKNRIKIKEYLREYYINNRDNILDYHRKYGRENKDKIREYRNNNRERTREWKRRYQKKCKTNIEYRVLSALRGRVRRAIKSYNAKKSDHTMVLIGCSIKKLIKHIESKFDNKMTWDNYGQFGWHIDHIKPCVSFDLKIPEEQRKCFNWKNLQPLWWLDNLNKNSWYKGKLIRKGDKICQP